MAPDRPTEADDLYALEPSEFVAARNELVRQLRAADRREEAAIVARLRRPTPSAWALNLVARQQPELVERALEAGHHLKDATAEAVGGKAPEMRQAIADDQAASGAVVEAAVRHLGDRGASLGPRVKGILRAAVLGEDVADELRRGVLDIDHEAGGFEFGEGFAAAPESRTSRSQTARDKKEAAKSKRRAELEEKVRALRERATELERVATQQEAAARSARAGADKAARELDKAEHKLDDA